MPNILLEEKQIQSVSWTAWKTLCWCVVAFNTQTFITKRTTKNQDFYHACALVHQHQVCHSRVEVGNIKQIYISILLVALIVTARHVKQYIIPMST